MTNALMLTLIAGLATLVGGFIGTHRHMRQKKWLSVMLAFAAGAMLCVSVAELMPEALSSLAQNYGIGTGFVIVILAMVAGIIVVRAIDKLLPGSNSVRQAGLNNGIHNAVSKQSLRSGMLIAAIITIHNIPEGLVTFTGALHDISLGIALAAAIALHNLPEGISIASPIYAATHSRWRAMKYTIIASLAEPFGALVGYFVLLRATPDYAMGIIFAASAGMMLYVSISELLPSAHLHATHRRQPIVGVSSGVGVMACSLLLFNVL